MDNIYYDGNLKASLTVGSVSDINPLNAYTKDQVNELLGEKSDVNHIHEQYLTEHQSLDHLALKEHTHEQYLTEHQSLEHLALKEHTHEQYLTEHQDISHLATKEEIPSIKGLATEEYVNNQIDAIPEVDLSNYATKEELETAVMSDVIREIKVVDELPEKEEEGILYLVRESGE